MHWVLVLIGLTVAIATTMWLSYAFTCSFDLATAAFTGLAVVAAILAYRAQDKQHAQVVLDAKRSQLWASFDSMIQLSELRRPSDSLVSTLNTNLAKLQQRNLNDEEELFRVLSGQWSVVEYWIVIGSWCNLMFTTEADQLPTDRNAFATLLVGAIGSDHLSALVEYAVRSSKSAFHPLILLLWLYGGVRDAYMKDQKSNVIVDLVDQNMRVYVQSRAEN